MTGGRGFEYENIVGAYFLLHLLIKYPPPIYGVNEIRSITFQDKNVPIGLDDKVLITQNGTVYVQVKSNLKIGMNQKFEEFIMDCLKLFSQPSFDKEKDKFLIIIQTYDKNDAKEFRDLLTLAYNTQQQQFIQSIRSSGSQFKNEIINNIRLYIAKFNPQYNENVLFDFIKCIRIKYLDFGDPNSEHLNLCTEKLRTYYKIHIDEANNLFTELFKISSQLNSTGGSIDYQTLYLKLIDNFQYLFQPFNSNLLTYQEYIQRREINKILTTKFVGRKNEFVLIDKFLNSSKDSLLIFGSGGIGKTRLIIEYVLKHQDISMQKKIYYLHSNFDMAKTFTIPSDSIVVVEDFHRYTYLERLVDIFSSQIKSKIKLIIIERSFFKNLIANKLIDKHNNIEFLELKVGDIPLFLRDNYPQLQEHIVEKINDECCGNFDYAMALIEYYNTNKKLDNLKNILSWKIERYINDYCQKLKLDIDQVKSIINIISMIGPISYNDINTSLKDCYSDVFLNELTKLIDLIENNNYNTLIFQGDNNFNIKPDPIADHILTQMLEDNTMEKYLAKLIRFFPFRIASNISRLLDYDNIDIKNKAIKYLNFLWSHLNINNGFNIEYFQSIGFLTSIIYNTNKDLLIEANIQHWENSFNKITLSKESSEYINAFSQCLFEAASNFAKVNSTNQLVNCVNIHRNLAKKYSILPINNYVNLLQVTITFHTDHNLKMTYLKEIEDLYLNKGHEILALDLLICYGNMISTTNNDREIGEIVKKYNNLYSKISSKSEFNLSLITSRINIYVQIMGIYNNRNNTEGIKEILRELLKYKKYKIDTISQFLLVPMINGLFYMTRINNIDGIYEFLPQLQELYSSIKLNKIMNDLIINAIGDCLIIFQRMNRWNDYVIWKQEYDRLSNTKIF